MERCVPPAPLPPQPPRRRGGTRTFSDRIQLRREPHAMAAPASINELLDITQKSGVVDESRLNGYLQQLRSQGPLPKEPSKLAGLMVRDGLLTLFQAEQLLMGKW